MKIIAWLAGLGTLLAGAFYMVVSLNRWEWNRALFFGLIVLIAEVGLATGLVLRRLARLEHNLSGPADPAVVQILSETRPTARPLRLDARVVAVSSTCSSRSSSAAACCCRGSPGSSIASRRRPRHRPARSAWLASCTRSAIRRAGCSLDDITVLAQDVPGADDAQIRQLLRRGGRP